MKAVVTGGAGFVGSHLAERLTADGCDVVCVEHPLADRKWLNGAPVDFRPCGLESEDDLASSMHGADVVFHLAALTQARRSEDFYHVNTDGTAAIMNAAARQQTPPLVVLASSLAAMGPSPENGEVSDRSVPRPLSHYGNSKLIAEAVVHSFADVVPSVIFRLSSVYGPREMAVLKLFKMIQHGVALTVGSWKREASLLYVADLVETLVRVVDRKVAIGQTYFLAHPAPTTWENFALTIGRVLDKTPRLISVPKSVAAGIAITAELVAWIDRSAAILNRERVLEISQQRWVCDVSKAVDELRFAPAYPVERGVRKTADWYRREEWI